ncbi:sterol desaturase family protein [Croceivirga radicis]|uniref:sterol desaturase family protein n=1 Tax=Croceivirga radicis TaxID=1929488 RepID=UPI000255B2A2|nr:sterol desaturase family protein [Croceivirga radicis]
MEILDAVLNINPNYVIIGLLALFFTLEQIAKTPFVFKSRGMHLAQNILFQLVLTVLNLFFVALQVYCIEWLNAHKIGLLYLVEIPFWAKLFLSVVLYDFTTYWIHRASHKVPVLWRLHRVHHSDTTMDSSTTFRFHPLELILIYQTGNILTALIFGTDVMAMAVYYLFLYVFFFLEHSNLNYPSWLNNSLGLIFVMPDHHRVHHHQEQYYTDSNFADIFIIWDRIFGTFKLIPVADIRYGLKEFESEKKQSFLYLMKSPFIQVESEIEKPIEENRNQDS